MIWFSNDVIYHLDVVADEILFWCEGTKETDPSPKSSPSGEDFLYPVSRRDLDVGWGFY